MVLISNARMVTGTDAGLFEGFLEFDESTGLITMVRRSASTVGRKVIDASGLLLLPGAVDCHVHFRDPGLTASEDFSTGSAAALSGGVTTVADMPNTVPPTVDEAGLREKQMQAKAKSRCDYLLYLGEHPPTRRRPPRLQTFLRWRASSFTWGQALVPVREGCWWRRTRMQWNTIGTFQTQSLL